MAGERYLQETIGIMQEHSGKSLSPHKYNTHLNEMVTTLPVGMMQTILGIHVVVSAVFKYMLYPRITYLYLPCVYVCTKKRKGNKKRSNI